MPVFLVVVVAFVVVVVPVFLVVVVAFVVVVVPVLFAVAMVVVPAAELEFDRVDVLSHLEHMHALGRDSFQGVGEALLETEAVRNHQIGCVHRLAVSQRRLVCVRVAALRDEGGHRDAVVAAHVADHVGPDTRGSDHRWHRRRCVRRVNRLGVAVGAGASCCEQHRGNHYHQSASTDPPRPLSIRDRFDRHVCLPYAPMQVRKSPAGALASRQIVRMRISFSYPIEAW